MASSASEADGNGTSSTGDVRGSQGSDDQIVKNMAKALKESTKRRRTVRRGKIQQDYHLEMSQLEASVSAKMKNIANRTSKLQTNRLESLRDLLEKKASVEADMMQSIARLDKAFANANLELQAVLTTKTGNYES
ncbi:MAG: hypothetical protein LQ337_003006 [Flavoplaca oasis]|nr:MAG: hypothetical protein LQ337_003006 [Flavoplaca oasis]